MTAPRLNHKRIRDLAALIASLPETTPLNFYSFVGKDGTEIVASDMYPPLRALLAVEFFFFVSIHNFGFWHGDTRYESPLYGTLGGKEVKGSDLLWKLILRAYTKEPDIVHPARLARMERNDFEKMFSDDRGPVGLLTTDERLELTRSYGQWFLIPRPCGHSPDELLAYANEEPAPAATLLDIITDETYGIPGYCEDPLKKKALLLLMALTNRPERLLTVEDDFPWDPIVDYHVMRILLRLGAVMLPKDWAVRSAARKFILVSEEQTIRETCFRANKELIRLSGRTMAEIDIALWSARRYCPEMTLPDCAKCSLTSVCAKRTQLFQPIFRTTFY